jgi:hypothetical protein
MIETVPLATRMRPQSLDEFVGQGHILAKGKPLYEAIDQGRAHSMVFWGPPLIPVLYTQPRKYDLSRGYAESHSQCQTLHCLWLCRRSAPGWKPNR